MNKTGTKSQNRCSKTGFTIIEMMIAVALFSVVGYMVFSALYTSKNIFNKTADKADAIQQIRFAVSTISKDIQNVSRSSDGVFIGSDNYLQIDDGRIIQDDLLSLSILSKKDEVLNVQHIGIDTVKFFLEHDINNRTINLKKSIFSNNYPENKDVRTLCKDINGLNFRYLKDNKWYDKWDSESLPSAVEITIEIGSKYLSSFPAKLKTIISIFS